jgi:hypothetical protein
MKFTTPPNKDYKQDISILHEALLSGENISFSKFCDGEWAVMQNKEINNKEFWFNPNSEKDQEKRKALIDAFQYKNNRYFVGITCVNVFGLQTHRDMVQLSQQDQEHLTWADIWVNSNYTYYKRNILSLYNNIDIVLVANRNAKIQNLPFRPYLFVPVEHNAWEYNWNLIEEMINLVQSPRFYENLTFLFCCGPFGNILCHRLTEANPKNTYLDIGSTLNPWLKSAGFERDYYMSNNFFSNMIGEWDNG